jgi:hypothetical protein
LTCRDLEFEERRTTIIAESYSCRTRSPCFSSRFLICSQPYTCGRLSAAVEAAGVDGDAVRVTVVDMFEGETRRGGRGRVKRGWDEGGRSGESFLGEGGEMRWRGVVVLWMCTGMMVDGVVCG